jgi:RNA polymerase sigma-70 factor (ECF subfamily)
LARGFGRRDSFEQVAMPNTGALLRTAVRISRSRSEAEDLVQETMLQAWRNFSQFEPGTNCKAWLFTIMLNLATRRRQRERPESDLSELELHAHDDPDQAAQAREVLAAVDRLPAEQRLVLMLATVEGFTLQEVAQMLDVPPGTANSRLGRARAALRESLNIGARTRTRKAGSKTNA